MKKKYIYFLIALAVALIVLGAVFRVFTPTEPSIPSTDFVQTNKDTSVSTFKNITYIGDPKNFPVQLPIAQINPGASEETVINSIKTKLNLVQDQGSPYLWHNTQDQYLQKDPYNPMYTLVFNPTSKTGVILPSIDSYISDAHRELTQTLPVQNVEPRKEEIKYIKEAEEFLTLTSLNEADAIVIPFAQSINGVPLLYKKQTTDPFVVTLNPDGKVIYINFVPVFISWQSIGEKDLISIDKAVTNINANKASLISYGTTRDTSKMDISAITSAQLNTVSLEYRVDEGLGLAYPFYRFSGEATDRTQQSIFVELITPAVETVGR